MTSNKASQNSGICKVNGEEHATEQNSHLDDNAAATMLAQSECVEPSAEPSFCQQICSWRMLVYLLLQFALVTLCQPRSTVNMAIVCSRDRRLEAVRRMNASFDTSPRAGPQYDVATGQGRSANFSVVHGVMEAEDWRYHQVMTDLNWDADTKGLVLSAPVFLASAGPLLTDVLRQRLGNRCVFTALFLLGGTIMFVFPVLARATPILIVATQIIMGPIMDASTPILGDVLAHWAPARQRLTASFIVFAGFSVGPIITSLVNGFLCLIPRDNGWPFLFYVSGVSFFLYAAAWNVLGADWPETHRFISEEEKAYILSARMQLAPRTKKTLERPPYLTIFRSPAFLAFLFLFSCFVWGNQLLFAMVPLYLSSVLRFSVQQTGAVFSGIVAIRLSGAFTWTVLGNVLVDRKILSSAGSRKLCLCLGFGGAACANLAVAFFDHTSRWTAVACIIAGQFLKSVGTSNLPVVAQDMAPRYAGTLLAVAFSVSLMVALTGPLVVSSITPQGLYKEWRVVWIMLSAVYLTGSLVFFIFGDLSLQYWAAVSTPGEMGDTRSGLGQVDAGLCSDRDVDRCLVGEKTDDKSTFVAVPIETSPVGESATERRATEEDYNH